MEYLEAVMLLAAGYAAMTGFVMFLLWDYHHA